MFNSAVPRPWAVTPSVTTASTDGVVNVTEDTNQLQTCQDLLYNMASSVRATWHTMHARSWHMERAVLSGTYSCSGSHSTTCSSASSSESSDRIRGLRGISKSENGVTQAKFGNSYFRKDWSVSSCSSVHFCLLLVLHPSPETMGEVLGLRHWPRTQDIWILFLALPDSPGQVT